MLTLSVSQKQLSKTVIVNCQCHKDRSKDNFPRQSQTVSVTKTAPKTTFQDTVNVYSVRVTKTASKTTFKDTFNVYSLTKTAFQDTANAKQSFKKIFYLSGCNKPQPQPDKYNIFIYYCSTVVLCL